MFDAITSDMFLGVLTEVTGLIPVLLPAVIGFMAFRKAWGFIRSAIAGA